MTVRRSEDGTVRLEGACLVEEAETLLELLQAAPDSVVDWTAATRLHTAVLQVLLAFGRTPVGPCGDAFVARWVEPRL